MVFFHEKVAISFFVVCFLEVGVFFEGYFIVFFGSLEFHEFNIYLTDVAIVLGNLWVSPDGLFVFFQCLWEFSYMRKGIPSL